MAEDEHPQAETAPAQSSPLEATEVASTAAGALRARSLLLVAVLCALSGTALGVLVLPRNSSNSDAAAPLPQLTYLGADLPLGEGAIEEALRRTRDFTGRSFSLALPDQKLHGMSLASLGAEIDAARLSQLLRDAREPGSALRRHWADIARGASVIERDRRGRDVSHDLPVPVTVNSDAALKALLLLKDDLDRFPRDARLDLVKKTVIPHVTGRWLDADATLLAMDQALGAGRLEAPAVFREREPKRRTEALAGLSFERILGHFETRYSRADKDADRTYNLHLAASKLDGTVLLPGEIFDFNEVVGPRDEANGYRVAKVIADGELVDGIGGGTCQVSGTLHGAAFFAGLDIVERYPHTRPSSYIKMGMDATVVYPTINFRVQNGFDFPIVLHETVGAGVLRAEILGPELDQVVTLVRRVDQALPYEELERPDADLPRGARLLGQRGVPGFRLHRYRIVRRGNHTLRERWKDIYPPTAQVVRVGTGPGGKETTAEDVGTPEYLADELLVLTLKRPTAGSTGEFAENREPGKFGKEGWTAAAGMPFWRSRN